MANNQRFLAVSQLEVSAKVGHLIDRTLPAPYVGGADRRSALAARYTQNS